MKENKSSVIFEEANEGCSRRTSTCYDRARWRDFACSKCLRGRDSDSVWWWTKRKEAG